MTNNSQMLANLAKSAQERENQRELLAQQRIDKMLQNLEQSLTASFNQRLDSIQTETQKYLYNNTKPLKIKISMLAMSFLAGLLVMMILSGIAWYQWIRPYQVSKEYTTQTANGEIYIIVPTEQAIKTTNSTAILIR